METNRDNTRRIIIGSKMNLPETQDESQTAEKLNFQTPKSGDEKSKKKVDQEQKSFPNDTQLSGDIDLRNNNSNEFGYEEMYD